MASIAVREPLATQPMISFVFYLSMFCVTDVLHAAKEESIFLPEGWAIVEDDILAIHMTGRWSLEHMTLEDAKARSDISRCVSGPVKKSNQLNESICSGEGTKLGTPVRWWLFSMQPDVGQSKDLFLLTESIHRDDPTPNPPAPPLVSTTVISNWKKHFRETMSGRLAKKARAPRYFHGRQSKSIPRALRVKNSAVTVLLAQGWTGDKETDAAWFRHPHLPDVKVAIRMMKGVYKESVRQYALGRMMIDGTLFEPISRNQGEPEGYLHRCRSQNACSVFTVVTHVKTGSVLTHVFYDGSFGWDAQNISMLFSKARIVHEPVLVGLPKENRKPATDETPLQNVVANTKKKWASFGEGSERATKKKPKSNGETALQKLLASSLHLDSIAFCPGGKFLWKEKYHKSESGAGSDTALQPKNIEPRRGHWRLVLNSGRYMMHLDFDDGQQIFAPLPMTKLGGALPGVIDGDSFATPNEPGCR